MCTERKQLSHRKVQCNIQRKEMAIETSQKTPPQNVLIEKFSQLHSSNLSSLSAAAIPAE
jgi:hypothetical protein